MSLSCRFHMEDMVEGMDRRVKMWGGFRWWDGVRPVDEWEKKMDSPVICDRRIRCVSLSANLEVAANVFLRFVSLFFGDGFWVSPVPLWARRLWGWAVRLSRLPVLR